MKRIPLGTVKFQDKDHSVLTLLKTWTEEAPCDVNNPQKPLDIATCRRRSRVISKLEKVAPDAEHVDIEEADWDVLKDALQNTPWRVSNPAIVGVIDGVLDAKDAPTIN